MEDECVGEHGVRDVLLAEHHGEQFLGRALQGEVGLERRHAQGLGPQQEDVAVGPDDDGVDLAAPVLPHDDLGRQALAAEGRDELGRAAPQAPEDLHDHAAGRLAAQVGQRRREVAFGAHTME